MRKVIILLPLLLFSLWLMGCNGSMTGSTMVTAMMAAPTADSKPPVITGSYGPELARYGDPIGFYIAAEDPNNDMLRLAVVISQVGYGIYETDWLYLNGDRQGRFRGYLQWNTSSRHGSIPEWTRVSVTISVLDKTGLESNGVVFPLMFVSNAVGYAPPPAPFDQKDVPRLGYIHIDLFNPFKMGNDDGPIWEED
jgi:hypothetical protein